MNDASNTSLPYASVEFGVGDELLVAKVIPGKLPEPLTPEGIKSLLDEAGYGNHDLEPDVLQSLAEMSQVNKANELDIEGHIDAKFAISIDAQQLTATLSFSPAFCGHDLTFESIMDEITVLSIPDEKVDDEVIRKVLVNNVDTEVTIANGVAPVHGEDGTIDVMYESDQKTGPRRLLNGQVDHYETHTYITVPVDTVLLRRNPPTIGTPGETIFATTIEATPGQDIQFELNDTVKLSDEDNNLLLAAKSGHPLLKPNSVIIDDTLTLEEASLDTGNVNFNGSVHIKGDVKPNIKIQASGDIFVGGLVENSKLISGNNVTIDSGIVSSSPLDESHHDLTEYGTVIEAQNDIQLKYCNSVIANAGGSILIENYSMHSQLNAKKDVILGIKNGKGILIGGMTTAQQLIESNVIGTEAFVETELHCADCTELLEQSRSLTQKLDRSREELQMLTQILDKIKASGNPATVGEKVLIKAKRIHLETLALKSDIKEYSAELGLIKKQLNPGQSNRIQVNQTIYPNVSFVVNDLHDKTTITRSACVIRKVNNELKFIQD